MIGRGVKNAAAVSAEEFLAALLGGWKHGDAPRRAGLAVSGGVDSMALVHLWKEASKIKQAALPPVKLYIVDHKARKGSTEEARYVQESIRNLIGTKPRILPVSWPKDAEPADLSNFESVARKLRYQALGRACRADSITRLLVAHHADDNAETVLARLVAGHRARGLRGMGSGVQVPECEGIYGVYQSGSAMSLDSKRRVRGQVSAIEQGGVLLDRPLLGFTKERLVATCQEADVPWIEDETNFDPTFTGRNALRSLLVQERLPKAVQRDSLLHLSATVQEQIDKVDQLAADLVKRCIIYSFDLRSGTMNLKIPSAQSVFGHSLDSWSESYRNSILDEALRRLMQPVCPLETLGMRKFARYAPKLFGIDIEHTQLEKFNVSGVLFEQLSETETKEEGSFSSTWQLSRQPFYSAQPPPTIYFPPTETPTSPKKALSSATESSALWDGRFWISVRNKLSTPVKLTQLTSDLWTSFLRQCDDDVGKQGGTKPRNPLKYRAKSMLRAATSPQNKWILPVLVSEQGRAVEVLALPTLGIVREKYKDAIKCDVRYKHFDITGLVEATPCVMRSQKTSQYF